MLDLLQGPSQNQRRDRLAVLLIVELHSMEIQLSGVAQHLCCASDLFQKAFDERAPLLLHFFASLRYRLGFPCRFGRSCRLGLPRCISLPRLLRLPPHSFCISGPRRLSLRPPLLGRLLVPKFDGQHRHRDFNFVGERLCLHLRDLLGRDARREPVDGIPALQPAYALGVDFALRVAYDVGRTVGQVIHGCPPLHLAALEHALVLLVLVGEFHHAETLHHASNERTLVQVSRRKMIGTLAMNLAISKLADVHVAVGACEAAKPMHFAVVPFAKVLIFHRGSEFAPPVRHARVPVLLVSHVFLIGSQQAAQPLVGRMAGGDLGIMHLRYVELRRGVKRHGGAKAKQWQEEERQAQMIRAEGIFKHRTRQACTRLGVAYRHASCLQLGDVAFDGNVDQNVNVAVRLVRLSKHSCDAVLECQHHILFEQEVERCESISTRAVTWFSAVIARASKAGSAVILFWLQVVRWSLACAKLHKRGEDEAHTRQVSHGSCVPVVFLHNLLLESQQRFDPPLDGHTVARHLGKPGRQSPEPRQGRPRATIELAHVSRRLLRNLFGPITCLNARIGVTAWAGVGTVCSEVSKGTRLVAARGFDHVQRRQVGRPHLLSLLLQPGLEGAAEEPRAADRAVRHRPVRIELKDVDLFPRREFGQPGPVPRVMLVAHAQIGTSLAAARTRRTSSSGARWLGFRVCWCSCGACRTAGVSIAGRRSPSASRAGGSHLPPTLFCAAAHWKSAPTLLEEKIWREPTRAEVAPLDERANVQWQATHTESALLDESARWQATHTESALLDESARWQATRTVVAPLDENVQQQTTRTVVAPLDESAQFQANSRTEWAPLDTVRDSHTVGVSGRRA
eukprot:2896251-Prymnesium_polylepis.2